MGESGKIVLSLPYACVYTEEEIHLVDVHFLYRVWKGKLPDVIVGIGIAHISFLAYALTGSGDWINLGYRREKHALIKKGKFPYFKELSDQVIVTVRPCSVWYTPRGGKGVYCVPYDGEWREKLCIDADSELIPFSPLTVTSEGNAIAKIRQVDGTEVGALVDANNMRLITCRHAHLSCYPLPVYPQWYKCSVSDNKTVCEIFSPQEKICTFVTSGLSTTTVVAGIDESEYAVFAAQIDNTSTSSLLALFSLEGSPDWAAVVSGVPEQVYLRGKHVSVAMREQDRYSIHVFRDSFYQKSGFLPSLETGMVERLVDINYKSMIMRSYRSFPVSVSSEERDLAVLLTAPRFPLAKQMLQSAGLPHEVKLVMQGKTMTAGQEK